MRSRPVSCDISSLLSLLFRWLSLIFNAVLQHLTSTTNDLFQLNRNLLFQISWIIKLTSVTPTSLIIARAIGGLGSGGCFVVIPVYIKEISQDSIRGALASLTMTMCKVGVIFVYAVGMWSSYKGNQAVYLAIAILHMVVFCFLPESPNYLLRLGKEKVRYCDRLLPTRYLSLVACLIMLRALCEKNIR